MIKLLARKKASVNVASDSGETPLSFAAGNGHLSTARLLLEHKASVKVVDAAGCTPLFYAVEDAAMVQYVIALLLALQSSAWLTARVGRG